MGRAIRSCRRSAHYQGFNTINGVSTEAIEQISISKGIASAEYGGTMSGNVNIITRGGSNAWRGSLFWNHQRDAFDASNPFVAATPEKRFNQAGGSFGGPVMRNTLFFFVNYEGVRSDRQDIVQGDVPTPEFRAQAIAAQPAYRALMDLYPQPNQPYAAGATNGRYIALRPFTRTDDHVTARIDYQMSSANRLNGRYSQGQPERVDARVVEANSRVWSGENSSGTLAFTHVAGSWVSETRLGFNRVSIERTDQAFNTGVPNGTVSGLSLSDGEFFTKDGDSFSLDQVVAMTRGRHSMKAGFNFLRQESGRDNLETPIYSYSSVADFLANVPSSARFTFGLSEFKIRAAQIGGFLQDDIRLGAKMVLNVGMRYDYFTVPEERDGRLFNRDDPFGTGRSARPTASTTPTRTISRRASGWREVVLVGVVDAVRRTDRARAERIVAVEQAIVALVGHREVVVAHADVEHHLRAEADVILQEAADLRSANLELRQAEREPRRARDVREEVGHRAVGIDRRLEVVAARFLAQEVEARLHRVAAARHRHDLIEAERIAVLREELAVREAQARDRAVRHARVERLVGALDAHLVDAEARFRHPRPRHVRERQRARAVLARPHPRVGLDHARVDAFGLALRIPPVDAVGRRHLVVHARRDVIVGARERPQRDVPAVRGARRIRLIRQRIEIHQRAIGGCAAIACARNSGVGTSPWTMSWRSERTPS